MDLMPAVRSYQPGAADPALPRTIGRRAWAAYWRAQREHADRHGAALPKHPENGWIGCPCCEGEGEINVQQVAEDDFIGDTCPVCHGDGEVKDGHTDPLIDLRRWRQRMRPKWSRTSGVYSWRYRQSRNAALGLSFGYALLDAKAARIQSERSLDAAQAKMIADADLCASESGRALAAWIDATRWVA